MDDTFKFKLELLKQEMDIVQNGIRAYSQVQFTIKGWALTIFSGFIFFAAKETEPSFLGLSAMIVVLFWILDSIFKSIQEVYIHRAVEIERFLQEITPTLGGEAFQNFPVPNTEMTFERLTSLTKVRAALRAGFVLQLALLYVAMLVAIGVLALVGVGQP